jgi:hypothetical protein
MELFSGLRVSSLTAIGDAAAGEIVRRQLDVDVITGGDADAEAPQTAGQAGQDRVAVFELDLERRAGEGFDDAADQAERIFFDDGCQGLTALLAAAALASARRGNGNSLLGECARADASPPHADWPREPQFHAQNAPMQVNFTVAGRVVGGVMLTGAIVFGMVGVAAGFTWDYVINRGK